MNTETTHDRTSVTRRIHTRDITCLSHLQPRKKLDPATIRRYAQAYRAGAVMPPLTVARLGPRLVLVGGWHRLAALKEEGVDEVEVRVIEAKEEELPWLAAKENMSHGLPLKNPEVREAFRAYVRAKQHRGEHGRLKSYREIAAELGKPHTTIRGWTQKDFPRLFKKMGDDGMDRRRDTGGLRDPYGDKGKAAAALIQLDAVLEVARGISAPDVRGQLVERLERALETIKDGGEYLLSDDNDDF